MAEHDRFELDLAAALRAYAAEAPTQVRPMDLARLLEAAHPHGRTAIGPWRLGAIPQVAWLLLLLAALSLALIGGLLVVGSQPVRPFPAVEAPALSEATPPPRVSASLEPVSQCPPGSTPNEPGPVDQARPPSSGQLVFDRAFGRIVLVASDGSVTNGGLTETWTFDVCTNTWTQMHPAMGPNVGFLDMYAYDVAARRTISKWWAYDLASDAWTLWARMTVESPGQARLVYDTAAARTVAIQVRAPHRIWSVASGADAWEPVDENQVDWRTPTGDDLHILLAYDASVDRLVGYKLGEVRLFDLGTATWSPPGAPSPSFGYGGYWSNGGEIAYDEAAQRTVLFSDGHVIAYDAAADRWETLYGTDYAFPNECGIHPECRSQPSMVYDPINERLVVYGGNVHATSAGYYPSDDVLAFDRQTREWTQLLAPSNSLIPGNSPSP